MIIVDSSVELISSTKPCELIERATRVCRKSEDKIGCMREERERASCPDYDAEHPCSNSECPDHSAQEFIPRLIKMGHMAAIEFSPITLATSVDIGVSVMNLLGTGLYKGVHCQVIPEDDFSIISGNLRGMLEIGNVLHTVFSDSTILDACLEHNPCVLKAINYHEPHSPEKQHTLLNPWKFQQSLPWRRGGEEFQLATQHVYAAAHFIIPRGISHELVRHRPCSFMQQSTRSVRQGDHVVMVRPPRFRDIIPEGVYEHSDGSFSDDLNMHNRACLWLETMLSAENYYHAMLKSGEKPEDARGALPIDVKTEVFVLAPISQWRIMFNLRCDGAAHHQFRELMIQLHEDITALHDPREIT